jgi:hypothetical protein
VTLGATFGGAGGGADEEDDDCAGTGIAGPAATGRGRAKSVSGFTDRDLTCDNHCHTA